MTDKDLHGLLSQLPNAEHLINQGRHGEPEQVLQQVQSRSVHPTASERAKARLNELQPNPGGN